MRIALVHDYFTQLGGAERVARELYKMLPHPDLFTTVALPACIPSGIPLHSVKTSWMQNLPGIGKYHRLYFPLYPLGIATLDLSKYDVVISSSSSYAKGVYTRSDALHVCYCHTPTRWVWRYEDYANRENFSRLQRSVLPLLLSGLKIWDKHAARQPNHFVANSQFVANRIQESYGRASEVIHPPIDVDRFQLSNSQQDYYLVLSRLVSYKRIDLAIKACNKLNRKLYIIGDGADRPRLQAMAGPSITFLGRLSDEDVNRWVSQCRALLFTGEEDFGMVPLEVAAAGKPTIAFRAGGALETIIGGVTGVFFESPDADSVVIALEEFESKSWSPASLRKHAERFSIEVFRQRFSSLFRALGLPALQIAGQQGLNHQIGPRFTSQAQPSIAS